METAYVYDMSASDALAHDDITLEFTDTILTRRWVHSNAVDEPVGFEEYVNTSGVGSGLERTMFADRQGSVLWVADPATGDVVAGYEYDAYGQITQIAGSLVQPYGYTGREYDPESGLYYYRARNYDPANGVFVQDDPIGFLSGSINIYTAFHSNPLVWTDPQGLAVRSDAKVLSAASGAHAGHAVSLIGVGYLLLANQIGTKLLHLNVDDIFGYPGYGNASNRDPGGGRCAAAIARVKAAKNNGNLRSCRNPELSSYEASMRAAAWMELGIARAQRDALCANGPQGGAGYGGEFEAHQRAWANFGVCTARTFIP